MLLVRHCEATGQEPGAPLTERGREQAQALATFLVDRNVDRVLSSPYERARQSIAPFCRERDLALEVDERLRERRISGAPIPEWREVLRDSFADPELAGAGGESSRETLERARGVLEGILSENHRLPALVSHGNWISIVLHALSGRFGFEGWAALSNPELTNAHAGRYERIWREAS